MNAWHEPIDTRSPSDPTGKRWYCVRTHAQCIHVLSISPARARTFAGWPGSIITADACHRTGEIIAQTAA